MNTEYLTPNQIRIMGLEALLRELGPAGMIRFVQQYETGQGDYTRSRHKILPVRTVKEIGREIMKERQKKPR